MKNTELLFQGIEYDDNEKDWKIGAESVLIIPKNLNLHKHYYNQAAQWRTRNGCGIYAALGCISDLTGYKFSLEEILECIKLAEESYGWDEGGGMYMSRAIDCARDYWNAKFPDQKIFSVRFTLGDSRFEEAIEKGHSLAIGYRTSTEYYTDSQDDGVVSGEDFPKGGGHLVRTHYNQAIKIDDNYIGVKKYNTYENNKIVTLRQKGVFFPSAYLFLKYDTMGEYETQYKAKYGNGTIYNDIEGALKKFGDKVDREYFFFNLIGMERVKATK